MYVATLQRWLVHQNQSEKRSTEYGNEEIVVFVIFGTNIMVTASLFAGIWFQQRQVVSTRAKGSLTNNGILLTPAVISFRIRGIKTFGSTWNLSLKTMSKKLSCRASPPNSLQFARKSQV